MSKYVYKINKEFTKKEGYSGVVWLLCALLFLPSVILLAIATSFTPDVEMVEVEYKKEGAWLSTRTTMTKVKFKEWRENIDE